MKKKTITLIAAMMSFCLLFAGCSPKTKPQSDTIKWINTTYAVLTKSNNGDIEKIGGYEKSPVTKSMLVKALKEWWEVTDRKSADETLDWLLKEGHRSDYNKEIAQIKGLGLLDISKEELEKYCAKNKIDNSSLSAMIDAYKKYGEHAIDAWDYCRAIQLLGYYYVTDYYTEKETLDKSLEIAKTLQKMYPSWDDMVQSYLYGYQYWQQDEEDISAATSAVTQRRDIYNELKNSKENPYQLDWNLELTKTWE